MKLVEVIEGTPEWVQWRAGGIGGADAAAIVGLSPWKRARDVWEIKRGEQPYPSRDDSGWGRRAEPMIRARYEEALGCAAPPVCCQSERFEWLRASLDGWVAGRALPVELKGPGRRDHNAAIDGWVPMHYLPQCLHILLATGAERMHYVSFNASVPAIDALVVIRVGRDEQLLDELRDREQRFWEALGTTAKAPPPMTAWRPPRAALARIITRVALPAD